MTAKLSEFLTNCCMDLSAAAARAELAARGARGLDFPEALEYSRRAEALTHDLRRLAAAYFNAGVEAQVWELEAEADR